MNPSVLAELSVPGPCCPPAGLGLLPGPLRAAPPLFPAAQHSVWHAAVLSAQVWSQRPGSLFVPALHLDQAAGPGKWKWAGRGSRGTDILLTFTETWDWKEDRALSGVLDPRTPLSWPPGAHRP